MSITGYRMRQGTVYRRRADGARLLLIHHDPLNMESLVLQEKAGAFDPASPALMNLDALIAMRRSGTYEEVGDLPAAEVAALIDGMISTGAVTEAVAELLDAIRKEIVPV